MDYTAVQSICVGIIDNTSYQLHSHLILSEDQAETVAERLFKSFVNIPNNKSIVVIRVPFVITIGKKMVIVDSLSELQTLIEKCRITLVILREQDCNEAMERYELAKTVLIKLRNLIEDANEN